MLSTRQIDLSSEIKRIAELGQKGQLQEANALCQKILNDHPSHPTLLFYAGSLALREKNFSAAIQYLQKAITEEPQNPHPYMQLGLTFMEMSQTAEAIQYFQKVISLQPSFNEAYFQLAMAYVREENYHQAEKYARQVIKLNRPHPMFHNTLGNILLLNGNTDEAINQFQIAISLHPNYAECYYNLASAYRSKGRYKKALTFYEQAISLKPDYLAAYHYASMLSVNLNLLEKASDYLQKAIQLAPQEIGYYMDITFILTKQKRYLEMIEFYKQALTIMPDQIQFVEGLWVGYRNLCDWDNMETWENKLNELRESFIKEDKPFICHTYYWWALSPEIKFEIIKNMGRHIFAPYIAKRFPDRPIPTEPKKKLRIGYVTADLRDHPAAHLTKNFYKYHNKERFEIFLYSIGPRDDHYSHHIIQQVDHFTDLFQKNMEETAEHIYNDQCDIVIDMNGFTEHSRTYIFGQRLAPIQMSWVGYLGSIGLESMDYIITDPIALPENIQQYYIEKPIYLPYSCFPADNELKVSSRQYSREEYNLPKDAFVLCCFNRHLKFEPNSFNVWMDLLHKLPHTVLWLYVGNEDAQNNLRKEATKRGIDAGRLLFAKGLPKTEYLARLRLADLFIDTFSYTAHTTAFDALWAGLPLITCLGSDPAARGSGGILTGANVPELITNSVDEYKEKIIYYATHPEALQKIKEKLIKGLASCPTFYTPYYAQWMEEGFEKAWELYMSGKKPEVIYVKDKNTYPSL